MLNGIMTNVVIQNVIMLNVIMQNVVAPILKLSRFYEIFPWPNVIKHFRL